MRISYGKEGIRGPLRSILSISSAFLRDPRECARAAALPKAPFVHDAGTCVSRAVKVTSTLKAMAAPEKSVMSVPGKKFMGPPRSRKRK